MSHTIHKKSQSNINQTFNTFNSTIFPNHSKQVEIHQKQRRLQAT